MKYINKRQENIVRLSKVAPKKLWRQILTRKTKDNNRIALKDWDSYPKKLYESLDVIDNIKPSLQRMKFPC